MEKCYRDIQNRGQIAKVNVLELFILIGVPLILFPIFTLFNLNTFVIILIEIALYALFRVADRISIFEYGLASFVYSRFIWPQKLSAFVLDERCYIVSEDEQKQQVVENKRQRVVQDAKGIPRQQIEKNGKTGESKISAREAAQRIKQQRSGKTVPGSMVPGSGLKNRKP